jgi:Hypothetical protein FLILHELTA
MGPPLQEETSVTGNHHISTLGASSHGPSMSQSSSSKFGPYKAALETLSNRTKTPLPSLIVSFAVLHEVTAVVPLLSVFFIARSLGIGEQAVTTLRREMSGGREHQWLKEKGSQWIDEGERWAARVGKRYGIFGFTKLPKDSDEAEASHSNSEVPHHIAGDVANAVLAYGVTKVRVRYAREARINH